MSQACQSVVVYFNTLLLLFDSIFHKLPCDLTRNIHYLLGRDYLCSPLCWACWCSATSMNPWNFATWSSWTPYSWNVKKITCNNSIMNHQSFYQILICLTDSVMVYCWFVLYIRGSPTTWSLNPLLPGVFSDFPYSSIGVLSHLTIKGE